ncbi:exodeoxyribonuclease V subunit gamma, partial [bacterium]|nr:exodeoxyribonuclease V subunit gamma [bacterium]
MSGFHIHSGNQLEGLAEVLAGFLREKKSVGVLDPEIVVVPSRGLERWLKLYLARVNGVSANLEFPFPQSFLEKDVFSCLRHQIDSQLVGDQFSKERLVWKIFFALGEVQFDTVGAKSHLLAVDNYLKSTGDELSRYHLALELADLFDRYLLFRPELIRAWERGGNPLSQFSSAKWQMELWRNLGAGLGKTHFAALQDIFNQMVYPEFYPESSSFSLQPIQKKLPQRLFLFGFAALPFNYLDLFKALSRLTEVHLFHVNPCAEFWGDQFSFRKQKSSATADVGGHPLLAAWGRLGRAFFNLNASLEVDSYREYFVTPNNDTLLTALQSQILHLQPPLTPLPCRAQDNSLQIHLCHGRQREVEIIYDIILDALANDPELKADDIFVMAPDIGLYSSYIEALFVRQRSLPRGLRLDYAIVSSKSILNLPAIKALFDLMRLLQSRFLLSEVFDLFSQEVVRQRFSVSESGLGLLSEWLRHAAVNWGLDGAFREEVSQVGFSENSLSWGLDRLLTGYGLAGSEFDGSNSAVTSVWSDEMGSDFLPLVGVEGAEAIVLGSFVGFVSALRKARKQLLQSLPAAQWRPLLEGLLVEFIRPPADDNSGLQRLRVAIEKLDKDLVTASKFSSNKKSSSHIDGAAVDDVSCETIMDALERELADVNAHSGFFTGGITFSSILPLRAVPARMI